MRRLAPSVALVLVLAALVSSAHTILYYPISIGLVPVAPAHVLLAADTPNTTVVLGPNETSANITLIASNQLQILQNPDFYSSPEYWLCIPGNYLSCYWASSDIGASGGIIEIRGTMPTNGTSDAAFIIQEVTIPATAQSIVIEARMRLALSLFIDSYTWYLGLYDPVAQVLYGTAGTSLGLFYSNISVNLTGYIEPGKTYYALVGISATSSNISLPIPIPISALIQLNIDGVYVYVNTSTYTFSGSILEVNTTNATAWGRLVFSQINSPENINATIELFNATGASSGKILVVNSVPQNVSTNWVLLGPPPTGYTSGYIWLEASKNEAANSTLYIFLELCYGGPGLGACAYYPLSIVIDPPKNIHCIALSARPIKLYIPIHSITNIKSS